jgi:hypothetical protein
MPIIDVKKIVAVCGAIGFVITIGGAYVAVDSRYAKAEDVKQIDIRLEQKILADKSDILQERLWKMEDRYGYIDVSKGTSNVPPEINDQYRRIRAEKQAVDQKLNIIHQKVSPTK